MFVLDINKNLFYNPDSNKLIDLNNLSYINEESLVLEYYNIYTDLSSSLDETMAQDALGWVWDGIKKVGSATADVVWPLLKKVLPEKGNFEDWIHFGIDGFSLLADILGPFTGGIGFGVSLFIDIIHGLYYIASSQGYIVDNRDKELEYLFSGIITISFAFVPGYGNAAAMGMRKMLQSAAKSGKKGFLIRVMNSNAGPILNNFFKTFANIGLIKLVRKFLGLITKLFNKLNVIPLINKIFKFLGITGMYKWVMKSMDAIFQKLFGSTIIKGFLKKQGMSDALIRNMQTGFRRKIKDVGVKNIGLETITASVVRKKIKQQVSRNLANHTNLTKTVLDIQKGVSDFTGYSDFLVDKQFKADLINALQGIAALLPKSVNAQLAEGELNKDGVKVLQKYLNKLSEFTFMSLEVNGDLDSDTIAALIIYLQQVIDGNVDLPGKEKAQNAINKITAAETAMIDRKDAIEKSEKSEVQSENIITSFTTYQDYL